MRVPLGAGILLAIAHSLLAQEEAVTLAVAAIQSGNLSSAEHTLQAELKVHPSDATVLEVLAAVLDQEKKYAEADEIYLRALAKPPSPSLLNNYANHLLATGEEQAARAAFAKVLAVEPRHVNAGIQMARLALEQHRSADAARYLERLPSEIQARPDVMLFRMRADYGLKRDAPANALLATVSAAAHNDAALSFALAEALSAAGKYDRAEASFSRTLELQPDNFQALYDLGLAADHAGHHKRARQTLEQALTKQPENVDVLYDLAAADLNLNRGEASLQLLAHAQKLAPHRADVQLLLARTASQLGYFADAVVAWEIYLKLKPDDDVAKREHAFAEMAVPVDTKAALADLAAYTAKHPEDPTGHYELGAGAAPTDPDKALKELTRALALKPRFAAAHLVRGMLLFRQNKLQLSLANFEKAAAEDPSNPAILEHLGQNYLALDRYGDALRVLQQAEQVAPQNPGVLLQLGRALGKAGKQADSAKIFARYRALGQGTQAVSPAGLVDFLSLSPAEQQSRYRAGVERTVAKNPENVAAQIRYLGLLLNDGRADEADSTARKIAGLQPEQADATDAVHLLLSAKRYGTAKGFLGQAAQRGISSLELQLDLAVAIDHTDGPTAALDVLNQVPASTRAGDFHLARSQFLREAKRFDEADQALDLALRMDPTRTDLYRAAALLLVTQDREKPALNLLERAVKQTPENPQLRTLQAVASALFGIDTTAAFQQIENRWPEWSDGWVAHALVAEATGQHAEAQRLLTIATSLGAVGAAVDFCEAGFTDEPRKKLLQAVPMLFGR